MIGFGFGMIVSIKWVGLFMIVWVGGLILVQFWVLWGDYKNVIISIFFKYFLVCVFCLIVIFVVFYMVMFGIYFFCLVNFGEGDGFMSFEFQFIFNFKGMQDVFVDVFMGSKVFIRYVNIQGGYFYLYLFMYFIGFKQQQIIFYFYKDDNNFWFFENQIQFFGVDGLFINGINVWNNFEEIFYIKNGVIICVYYVFIYCCFYFYDVCFFVIEVEWQNEVFVYGYEGFDGDVNDFFCVEIVKKKFKVGVVQECFCIIDIKFRFVYVMIGCVLFLYKVKFFVWVFEQ